MIGVDHGGRYSDTIEARSIASALTVSEYVLRGGRSHLFLLVAGCGQVQSDDSANALEAPGLFWLPQGRPRKVRLEAGTRGLALSIPDPLLGRSLPGDSLGSDIREMIGHPAVVRNLGESSVGKLQRAFREIEQELFENRPASQTVVQYCLSLMLVEIWRVLRPQISSPKPLPRTIVHNFIFLVDLHLRDHWTVRRYAEHMGVSKDRLNTAVRRATGHSPLALIHRRLMAEAQALLTGSGLQISEIAYKLGFGDAAYFSRFFQRHAGLPPGKFRHTALPSAQEPSQSFAAWP